MKATMPETTKPTATAAAQPAEHLVASGFKSFASENRLQRGPKAAARLGAIPARSDRAPPRRIAENPTYSDEQKYIKERTDLF